MKAAGLMIVAGLLLAGCGQHQDAAAPESHAEPEPIAVTNWTPRTELFMEYPPLVVGQRGRAAVHFTDLRDFTPLSAGAVSIHLRRNGQIVQSFQASAPSRPGIFGVDLEPAQPGQYQFSVQLTAPTVNDTHELGEVTVYASAGDAGVPAEDSQEEAISFLKEQQWTLDFATEIAATRSIRESLLVTGEVSPRTGADVQVVSPIHGRIGMSGAALPLGAMVAAGQELARIAPQAPEPASLPSLELEIEQARSHLDHKRRERERIERLVSVGAAPQRRLHETREEERLVVAQLKAAEARLALYEENRRGGGEGDDGLFFTVRAPIAGEIAAAAATPGSNVAQGESLFRIIATDRVHVIVHLPEAEAWRARSITGAEIELPGTGRPVPVQRLLSDSRYIDPETRTLRLIYEMDNPERRLAIGQSLSIRVFLAQAAQAVAIPEGAIVDDGGRPVVFIQLDGEGFARRPVTLGPRASGYVQVLGGVRTGERVVSRGAYLIRLAALSPTIPAHGHAH